MFRIQNSAVYAPSGLLFEQQCPLEGYNRILVTGVRWTIGEEVARMGLRVRQLIFGVTP
jgi:hypothetical protein